MYIKKGYILIGIGLLLVVSCSINLFTNMFLFDDGGTYLEYSVFNKVSNEDVKSTIEGNTSFAFDKLSVIQNERRLHIEFDRVEMNELVIIEELIDQTYGDDLQFVSSSLLGPIEPTGTIQLIFALLIVFLIIGIWLIIKGYLMLKKEKVELA